MGDSPPDAEPPAEGARAEPSPPPSPPSPPAEHGARARIAPPDTNSPAPPRCGLLAAARAAASAESPSAGPSVEAPIPSRAADVSALLAVEAHRKARAAAADGADDGEGGTTAAPSTPTPTSGPGGRLGTPSPKCALSGGLGGLGGGGLGGLVAATRQHAEDQAAASEVRKGRWQLGKAAALVESGGESGASALARSVAAAQAREKLSKSPAMERMRCVVAGGAASVGKKLELKERMDKMREAADKAGKNASEARRLARDGKWSEIAKMASDGASKSTGAVAKELWSTARSEHMIVSLVWPKARDPRYATQDARNPSCAMG